MAEQHILDPNVRVVVVGVVADRLHATFKGTTGIDLDVLAASIVDELVDPISRHEYETRDVLFTRAMEACIDFAVSMQQSLNAEVTALRIENDKLAVRLREVRDQARKSIFPPRGDNDGPTDG